MAGIKFVHKEEKEVKIKGTPKVPIDKSKKLSSLEGNDILYYIDKSWGMKNKLESKMNFTQLHPTDENFCLITIPIDRI